MGARGPKPDPDQAAKGFPGRRKGKAAEAAANAKRLARLLMPGAGAAEAPAMLHEPRYAPALVVWKSVAPELRRTHRLPPESENLFMAYCIYVQEWAAATDDLHTNGSNQKVGTIAGGHMERRRPVTFDRQMAFQNITYLASKFGFTAGDMYALYKNQMAAMTANPGLFDDDQPQGSKPAAPATADVEGDAEAPSGLVGIMARLSTAPPTVN